MSFTVTNNVKGTTATVKENGGDYTITLTGAVGGTFTETPVIYNYENEDGDWVTKNYAVKMTVNGNVATGTITSYSSDECTIDGTFSGGGETFDITNNIANTTAKSVINDNSITVTVTGNSDGMFSGTPTATYELNGKSIVANLEVSGKKASIEVSKDVKSITLDGTFLLGDYSEIEYNLVNCSVPNDSPKYIKTGDTLSLTITANENAELKEVNGGYTDENGDARQVQGTISQDKKTATISFNFPTDSQQPYIYANADIVEPVGKNYGAINVYLVTLDNLDAFSKKRFFKFTDSGDTGATTEEINLGIYVNRIKRVFVNVPVSGTDVIKCGNYSTGIVVDAPKTDIVTVDFGNVTITGLNSDSNDFNGNVTLFIPMYGFVTVNNAYIGKEINLTIKANIVTGDGIAILSYNDVPFQFVDITISRDVIYRTGATDLTLIGGTQWGEQNLYGFEPYLLVENTPTVSQARNNTNEPVTIGSVNGFAQFENVELEQTECLETEYNDIISLLGIGVYI